MRRCRRAAALALCLGLAACGRASHSGPALRVLQTWRLGGEGYWDYLAFEPERRRLFIARSSHVMVVDVERGESVGDIPGTDGVHGIAFAPELGRGFTSNGKAASSTIFDLATLAVIGSAKTGDDPDAIVYEPVTRRVFTMNGRSFDATAIDAATGEVVGTVPLGGRPEFAVADGAGKIFADIKNTAEVAVLDARGLTVLARWPVAPGAEPSGLALDAEHHRLFVSCRNRKLVVLDSLRGRVIASLPIGAGTDGAAFDPARGLAYSSNDDGTLSVVREDGPDTFTPLESVSTAPGARTLALDPATHRLYLATAEVALTPSDKPGAPPRLRPVAGTFKVLVVGE